MLIPRDSVKHFIYSFLFQRIFEENRNAEFVETQRLEEQERRRQEEKVSISDTRMASVHMQVTFVCQ